MNRSREDKKGLFLLLYRLTYTILYKIYEPYHKAVREYLTIGCKSHLFVIPAPYLEASLHEVDTTRFRE